MRGFFKDSKSELKDSLVADSTTEIPMCDLIREDWKDMLSAFYFPRQAKMLKDDRIHKWVESVNTELTEDG